MTSMRKYSPVLVIGAGIAGCIAALRLADSDIPVTLLAASQEKDNGNSWKAQGGIIFRGLKENDAQLLEQDILVAGHNHNNQETVRHLCQNGPDAVEEILVKRLNIPFDRIKRDDPRIKASEWDLTREGGHSVQRIIHCADHTGLSIMDYLTHAVEKSANITFLRGYTAVDLLTSHHHTKGMTYRYQLQNQCCGAYVLNEQSGMVETLLADLTVLATGGVGQVYLHSTNSPTSVGAGVAMASRAFVGLENMEYMQFHPTSLFHVDQPRFLITEALRGEGALLVNAAGKRFMGKYDPREELAPRDIVARSIIEELFASGEPCVFLDARNVKNLAERFPTVMEHCLSKGIAIEEQLIPVVPAAHYFCGGILVDYQGRTTLERLYAAGETTCTGVHGSNRLASTSLLEAVLWGKEIADDIVKRYESGMQTKTALFDAIKDWQTAGVEQNDDPALIAQDWSTIRNTMWNYVGITRTESRLARAFSELRDLSRHLHTFYKTTPVSKPLIDLFHGCQTAYLITQAASRNKQSLGCHYRTS